ncbi:MAG: vitamin B12-dependent ribonucleotide reductase, partial [Candidatus Omnitrophica bacterium]|nr:vitamin B12-dependent ribonucleotide reductase [Candidatus Omnitrophota bacterium]
LGEVFIVMSKEGSTLSGMVDSFATAVSLALQYGVPLKVLADKFSHVRFEPSGITNNPQIRFAKSIVDYVFRWLALKFLSPEERPANYTTAEIKKEAGNGHGELAVAAAQAGAASTEAEEKRVFVAQADAPTCSDCGSLMVRSGNCYKCHNCGATSGCS